jgi:hypothetical protein
MMQSIEWDVVTRQKLMAFCVGLAVFFLLVWRSEPGFVFLLDLANLLFHEAGHPFFGLFSDRLMVYGGTLGQLVFPVALAVSFWRKGESLGFAAAWIWFFENWLNIGRYMADARSQMLPLVGGGEHDWTEIFNRWHVLQYDIQIGAAAKWMGWVGMLAAVAWFLWRFVADRSRAAQPTQTEDSRLEVFLKP